jgi:hypothetical protein
MLPKRLQIYARNNAEKQITTTNEKKNHIFSSVTDVYECCKRNTCGEENHVKYHDPW